MLHSTDTKKLNKKEDPSKEAWVSLRRENKMVLRGRWKEGTGKEEVWRWEWETQDHVLPMGGRTGDINRWP